MTHHPTQRLGHVLECVLTSRLCPDMRCDVWPDFGSDMCLFAAAVAANVLFNPDPQQLQQQLKHVQGLLAMPQYKAP